ncbi:MAG: hypothetical protein IJZ04_05305 [Clostridia bacterium]|nr:hypothetical protein [Clostridia bacterium]MBQ8738898.1 hypothetical protein [Clostridia bacterium]
MSEKKEAKVEEAVDRVLKIEREPYVSKKTGKPGFTYYLKGTVRGREVKAKVVPKDKGGFEVLDIIYDGAIACDLRVEKGEMKNEDGDIVKFETYTVFSKDPTTGEEFDLKVKPDKDSDKAKFKFILRQ